MPAADSLAALMKEWPLNSVTLSTATHSKLREALDGTDTQVATCTSNRWTAKMKGAEEYITREVSRRKEIAIRKTPEGLSWVVSKEEKKNSSSDEAWWQTFTPPLRRWRSCPTVDEVLTMTQFLSLLLYQIYCIGPVGFGFPHSYSEGPPKSGPYNLNLVSNRFISNFAQIYGMQ